MATQQGCHAGSPRRGAGHCRPLQASQRAGSGPYQHRRSQSLAPFSPLDDARLPRFGALVATGWPPHDFLRIRRHWAARFVERAGGCSPSASPLPRPYPSLPSLHLLTSFLLRAVLNCPFCWCFSSAGIASSCPLLSVAPLQRAYPRPSLLGGRAAPPPVCTRSHHSHGAHRSHDGAAMPRAAAGAGRARGGRRGVAPLVAGCWLLVAGRAQHKAEQPLRASRCRHGPARPVERSRLSRCMLACLRRQCTCSCDRLSRPRM